METWTALDELLAAHPFLAGTDGEFQSYFAECASLRRFGSHQHIFQQGGEADHFYLILHGRVSLAATVGSAGWLPIQILGEGEALGWSWLFPPYQWCFAAMTVAPTEVISLGAQYLRERAEHDPAFGSELLRRVAGTVVQRLQATRNELVQLYSGSGERRAA